jgi:hypothetical protein
MNVRLARMITDNARAASSLDPGVWYIDARIKESAEDGLNHVDFSVLVNKLGHRNISKRKQWSELKVHYELRGFTVLYNQDMGTIDRISW